ncbi:MAG: NYN domain-containing protein [Candidatus Micrarchaeia archaeon]
MKEFIFKLKGKTLVIIDWANVYGWFGKLKWEIDPKRLYDYLKSYPEIFDIRFYFGLEKGNEKSENFHKEIKSIGYNLIWKEVKWVPAEVKVSHHMKYKDKTINLLDGNITKEEFERFKRFLNYPKELGLVRRKCDFDVEITLDVMRMINDFDSLILFSGDGDFKALCEYLLDINKQVIVVHPFGVRGKEYNELLERPMGSRPYLCAVEKLTAYIKKSTPGV